MENSLVLVLTNCNSGDCHLDSLFLFGFCFDKFQICWLPLRISLPLSPIHSLLRPAATIYTRITPKSPNHTEITPKSHQTLQITPKSHWNHTSVSSPTIQLPLNLFHGMLWNFLANSNSGLLNERIFLPFWLFYCFVKSSTETLNWILERRPNVDIGNMEILVDLVIGQGRTYSLRHVFAQA